LALGTLNQKLEGSYTNNKNLGKWVELIYMGISPLGPLLAIILDLPSLVD
jgi:hypothetical protein